MGDTNKNPLAGLGKKEDAAKAASAEQVKQVESTLNKDLPKAEADENHDSQQTGAHIKEDANKELGESNNDELKVQQQSVEEISTAGAGVAPGVVQEDNIGSNDHGQADPRNNEISEFEASQRGGLDDLSAWASPDLTAASVGLEAGEVAYTSHPIANYQAGKFRFDNGVLRLTKSDDIAEFEQLLDDLPESERHKIKKLNIEGAEAISRKVQAQTGVRATQQTDSTIGDRGVKPLTGRGDLRDSLNGGAVE